MMGWPWGVNKERVENLFESLFSFLMNVLSLLIEREREREAWVDSDVMEKDCEIKNK